MSDLLAAPPVVYALALLPALLWGFSPVLSKRGMAAGGNPLQASLVVVVVDTAIYWVAIALLRGSDLFGALSPTVLAIFLLAGVFGTALGRLATFAGVERVGASVNSAAISARPLFATLLAIGFLGESVTAMTVAGVVVLVVGLATLALSRGGDLRGWTPRHLLYPLAAAACFAVGNVMRRFGLTASPATALDAVVLNETAALVVLGGYALATGTERLRVPRETYRYFLGSGTLTAVALLSLFAALGHPEGRVAIVDPLAATAPLFTAAFAALLLGDLERVTRGVVVGAALVVAGVVLVTLGPGAMPA